MPASGRTPNFNLPQYRPLDTVSELVTFNGAMSTVDTALQNIKNTADTGSVDIDDIRTQINELKMNVNALKQSIGEMPGQFKWREIPLNLISGVTSGYRELKTDGHIVTLCAAADYGANVPIKVTVNGAVNIALFSTPENVFNMEDNTKALAYVVYAKNNVTNNAVSTGINIVRQNSITYLCANIPPQNQTYHMLASFAVPIMLNSGPL